MKYSQISKHGFAKKRKKEKLIKTSIGIGVLIFCMSMLMLLNELGINV